VLVWAIESTQREYGFYSVRSALEVIVAWLNVEQSQLHKRFFELNLEDTLRGLLRSRLILKRMDITDRGLRFVMATYKDY